MGITRRRRNKIHNALEKVLDALARLAGNTHGILCGDGQFLLYFFLNLLRTCAGKINLVDSRHNVQISIHGKSGIRDGLCLYTLCCINNQNGTFTGSKRARHFIGKVNMAWRINKIKLVLLAIARLIHHAYRVGLDGNATLTFNIHGVQQLLFHITLFNRMGKLQNTVRNR